MTLSSKALSSAVLVCSAAFSTLAMAQGTPVVWTAPSLHRVGMSDPAGAHTDVNLSAARGEYESFQIVANGASNGLSNVNVTISDLQGPDRQVIPRTNFTLYREKYVYVKSSSPNWKGSNQPLGPGWYPDALIPFTDPETGKTLSGASLTAAPFEVKAGANQPIWVDLLVPRSARPGKYSGTYTITSNHGDFTGSISLKVWNFALPVAPGLKSSFLFFQAGTLAAQRELLRNKLSPLSTNPADQPLLMKEHGLSTTQTGPFSGADIGRCAMSPAPSVSQFKSLASAQQPGLMLYNYSADEIGHCTNLYPTIRAWANNMHQAGQRVSPQTANLNYAICPGITWLGCNSPLLKYDRNVMDRWLGYGGWDPVPRWAQQQAAPRWGRKRRRIIERQNAAGNGSGSSQM